MISVFVSGAGGGIGQGIIKSLKAIPDLDIRVVAADMDPLASGLYSADYSYLVPAANGPDYFDCLSEIFRKEDISFYFPGTDVELSILASNAKKIRDEFGVDVVVGGNDAIDICDDKYLTFDFLNKNGFFAPTSYLPESFSCGDLNYPLIVKPRYGFRSIGVRLVNNEEELKVALSETKSPVIQEYLDDEREEYTCTIVSASGLFSEVVVFRRNLRSGDTYKAIPVDNPEMSSYIKKVSRVLNIEGACNFQLRMHNGKPKIFEINCRFSGTTPFCTSIGFNPVEFYLKRKLGIPYEYSVRYDVLVLRHWAEQVIEKDVYNELVDKGCGKLKSVLTNTL